MASNFSAGWHTVVMNHSILADHDSCYRAIQSSDRRFDGQFFTAVSSTGIYCRPVCTAVTPKSENVSFYASAAAAAQAGYRPCLRCHPEAAPGSADWIGAGVIAQTAWRLIDAGYADEHSLAQLAEQFDISDRHLRRLFLQTYGATPVAVAQTRRLHLAKQLLDETSLPIADIAFAAGYGSLRRFNTAMRNAWGSAPSVLRRLNAAPKTASAFTLHLSYRPPYDWPQTLAFLRRRLVPGVERIDEHSYARSVSLQHRDKLLSGTLRVSHAPAKHALKVELSPQLLPRIGRITSSLRRLFDLDANPEAINAAFASDSLLGPASRAAPGTRVPGAWDGFEVLVRAVLGQQVSVAAALTLVRRVVEKFGTSLHDDWRLFPTPAAIAIADLSGLGITGRRIEVLKSTAQKISDGELDLNDGRNHGGELHRYIAALVAQPGIGDWTAQYIAMRSLGHPNAFPAGDLILRRAATINDRNQITGQLTEKQLRDRAESWQPWRAYAVIHLWRCYDTAAPLLKPEKKQ